jgi:hypothetical protein
VTGKPLKAEVGQKWGQIFILDKAA